MSLFKQVNSTKITSSSYPSLYPRFPNANATISVAILSACSVLR